MNQTKDQNKNIEAISGFAADIDSKKNVRIDSNGIETILINFN